MSDIDSDNGKREVLVLCAHPDDAEAHASGTVAAWVKEGWTVRYIIFTSGDKGTDDPNAEPEALVALREQEQHAAAAILGVEEVTFLRYGDGELSQKSVELTEEVTNLLRRYRPRRVMTLDPYAGPPDYRTYQLHPDHRALGFAVLDAVYFRSPGPLFYPEQVQAGLHPHRVDELYLFMGNHADFYVDIGETFEQKLAALQAHHSQWGQHPDLEGMFRQRAVKLGQANGYEMAEAFKRLTPN